ncbi:MULTISPECIES: hypothetical protein [Calditerrivibrio]|uniref:Uncharacterized protein n=1 Tax=Calditerrivibrio nitroreducens TaxID=477976 RepID=A0A2J6WMD6_9BACT|nr:MAG: hypothetical protein C0187_03845 [Calditerrivibrio nitroreducens]
MSFKDIEKIQRFISELLIHEGDFEKDKNILVNLQKSILCFSMEDEKNFDYKKADEIASVLLNKLLGEKNNESIVADIGRYAFTAEIDNYLINIKNSFLSDDYAIHKLELDISSSKVTTYFQNKTDGGIKVVKVSKEGILFLDDAIIGVIDGEFYQKVYDYLTQEWNNE